MVSPARRQRARRIVPLALALAGLLAPTPPRADAAEVTVELPRRGAKIIRQKTWDPEKSEASVHNMFVSRTGRARAITDEKAEKLIARERHRNKRKNGALTKAFHDKLAKADPEELFKFMAAIPFDSRDLPGRIDPADVEDVSPREADRLRHYHRIRLQEALLKNEVPFLRLEKKIAQYGGSSRRAAFGPFVYGELPAKALLELSRQVKLLKGVYESGHETVEDLNDSVCAMGGDLVQATGNTGFNLEVAVMETGRVDPTCLNVTASYDNSVPVAAHATLVAGVVASPVAGFLGVAPGVNILTAPLQNDGDLDDAMEWSLNNGADVVNMSFSIGKDGEVEGDDELLDWIVYYDGVTIAKSAGNTGPTGSCSGTNNVTTPGLGYNVITVGNHTHDTTCSAAGFTMSGGSCWIDPESTHDDRDKPELSAPGTGISTTPLGACMAAGVGVSGTSFSTPHVAGAAALLIRRDLSLRSWPEAVKALLMVGSRSFEGRPLVDDRAGVGGIDVDRSDRSIQFGRYKTETWTNGSWNSNDDRIVATFNVQPQTARLRVALVWSSADEGDYPDEPSSDVDLYLEHDGVGVARSDSFDNNFEIVELTNPPPGQYKIRARLVSGWLKESGASEYAAAAWALDEHPCTYDGWDVDGDGICGIPDNCPNTPNASQADSDADGVGDACDNCIGAPNPGQEDMDNDGEGDACDTDIDGDGCENGVDEDALDPTQVVGWWTSATCTPSSGLVTDWAGTDSDGDGIRDCQEPDNDADGVPDAQDVCPTIYGTNPAMCMQYEDCPLISIFSMCEIVPCLDILVMIDSLINPDPTTIFERVDVIAEGVLRLQVAQGENPREIARLMARGFGVQLDREDAAAIEVHFDRARLVGDLVGDAIHVNVVDGVAEVSMGE